MGRSYSVDLRARVVSFIEAGQSRRAAAARLGTGESFAIRVAKRFATSGSLEPAKQGRPAGKGKLAPYTAFLTHAVEETPDITMPQLCERLAAAHDVTVDPAALSRFLRRHGYSYKKNLDGGGARTHRRA